MKIIRPGRLEVITGPMFSGKSDELIRRVRRYGHAGLEIQAFYPLVGDRYGVGFIITHDDDKLEAIPINNFDDFLNKYDLSKDGYALDEIQFLDGRILDIINDLRTKGKFVLASGLNLDYAGRPFKFLYSDRNIGDLLVMADDIVCLTAVCKYPMNNGKSCGEQATRTQRLVESKDLVLVGGKKFYEARCPKHHIIEDG